MKASSIWPGTDYAYVPYRHRGGPLQLNAKRVKVIRTYEEQKYGRARNSTFAEVFFLEDDGELKDGAVRRSIETRNIIALWDDYEAERAPALAEHNRREAERRARYAEQQRKYEEERAIYSVARFIRGITHKAEEAEKERLRQEAFERELKRKQRIVNVMVTRGFDRSGFSMNGTMVHVSLDEMERWLGIVN